MQVETFSTTQFCMYVWSSWEHIQHIVHSLIFLFQCIKFSSKWKLQGLFLFIWDTTEILVISIYARTDCSKCICRLLIGNLNFTAIKTPFRHSDLTNSLKDVSFYVMCIDIALLIIRKFLWAILICSEMSQKHQASSREILLQLSLHLYKLNKQIFYSLILINYR